LLYPGKITADAGSKRLYISDTGHDRIVVTDLDGKFLEGIGIGKPGLIDGDYKTAGFDHPQGTCLLDDILYVADTENHALRAVDLKARTVKTVAGDGQRSRSRPPLGKGTATPLNSPWDVIPFPGTKMLAVAMAGPHQIWRYDVIRGTIGPWAGSGSENLLDGTLTTARFAQPSGLATDGTHLFVADSEVSGVRSISLGAQHRVSTIVGSGLFVNGDQDGRADAVRLQHCLGLAFGDGKLYIADTYNNKVKACDPRNRSVEPFVGGVARGMSDDPPRFNEPGGLSLAGSTLYVADTNNHAIRAVDVESKKVRTLDLSTVKPPVRTRSTSFANPTVFNLAPVQAMPGREVTLEVAIPLPPGFKLSAEAPINYLAEADPPGSLGTEVSPTGQRLAEPAREFAIKLPLARPARTGSTMTLKFSVSAFVCLPNSLCTVKNYVWNVPITFAAGSPTEIQLTTAQ
jgi:DNA-binding beta-propeller fold protein YncE